MKNQQVKVKLDEENPEPMELIAKAIIDLAAAYDKMKKSGVKDEVIVLLLHDYTKVGKPDIRRILSALPILKNVYLVRK